MNALRAEMFFWSLASIIPAVVSPVAGLPPEQQVYLWSCAGTAIGAVVAGVQMPAGATRMQRVLRAFVCVLSGLLLAPYAIAYIPKPEELPHWWHAFGASGLAAAVAYVFVAEAPAFVRGLIGASTAYNPGRTPRRRRSESGESSGAASRDDPPVA